MSESCVKISDANLVFFMVVSFQIELYWFPRTLLSLVDVCIELIDGEDESNPREKPEETTTIRDDTTFEKQSALFALAISDIVLINM